MNQAPFQRDFAVDVSLAAQSETVIAVRGELDSGSYEELMEAFRGAVDQPGTERVTLDLRELSFIDSAGTRAVIMIEQAASRHGVELRVNPPSEGVTELLRTAGVIQHFQLKPEARAPVLAPADWMERVELELPREPQSPARARAEVRELMRDRDPAAVADLVLLTSEIVTNAVVHVREDGTPIGLRLTSYADLVRVEVEDTGDGFDPTVPIDTEPDRGRGLFLVDRFASRWGAAPVETDEGPRFRVWFELEWDKPRKAQSAAG